MSLNDASRDELVRLLSQARQSKDISVRAAAKLAGVPTATAQGWLSGKHLPTPALRDNFRQLLAALDLRIPEAMWNPDAEFVKVSGRAPYLGLRPFGVDDAGLYFGRSSQARRLADLIDAQPERRGLIALVGGSGSGKSSLLAAGLIGGECVDGRLAGWSAASLTAQTLTADVDADVIVIDQFEEILQQDVDRVSAAMDAIHALAQRAVVVIGLRSDAFGVAAEQPVLAAALEHPMLLAPMTREELVQAIVCPAELEGVEVEPELVDLLLADLARDESGGQLPHSLLPLLSSALLMVWSQADRTRMTTADYVRMGGLASAVETLAENTYLALPPDQQELVPGLLLRLISVHGEAVLRTQIPMTSLSESERTVAEQFLKARLLSVQGDQLSISHDALLQHWHRLAEWVDDGRLDLRVREHLRRATSLWLDNDRSPDSLLPVGRLPVFTEFVADPRKAAQLSADERDFVTRSEEHFTSLLDQEKASSARLRRQHRLAITLAVIATATALVAVFTLVNTRRVKLDAQSRQIAYAIRSNTSGDVFLEAQMALAANDLADTVEARSVLLDTNANDVPTRWLGNGPSVMAKAPDDSMVIRAGAAGELTLWRSEDLTATPGQSWTVSDDTRPMYAIDIAKVDGRVLAAAGGTKQASIWDVTGEPERRADIEIGDETILAMAFDPDGRSLVLGDSLGHLRVFSLADPGNPRETAEVDVGASVTSVAFDPTRSVLLAGGASGSIRRWSFDGAELAALPALTYEVSGRTPRTQSMAVSPDGHWLVAGLGSRASARWDLTSPDVSPVISTDYASWVNSVRFADANTYITADSGQHVRVVDAATDQVTRFLSGPMLMTGAETVNGRPVAVDTAGTLMIWTRFGPSLRLEGQPAYQFAGDAAGSKWLAYADLGPSSVDLWSLTDGLKKMPSPVVPADVTLYSSIWMDGAGTMLWAGSTDGRVVGWRLSETGASEPFVQRVLDESAVLNNVVVDKTGRLMVVSEYLKKRSVLLRVADDGSLTELAVLDTETPQIARFSADSGLLSIGIAQNEVKVWSLADPEHPEQLPSVATDSNPSVTAMSPAGPMLAAGTDRGTVSVWDLSNVQEPKLVHEYHQSQAAVYGLNFSPDGTHLMAAGGDEVFYMWDLEDSSDSAEFILDGRMGRTTDLMFLGDGSSFVGAGNNGEVKIWDLDLTRVEKEICDQRGTPLSDLERQRAIVGVKPFDPCR